MSEEYSLFQQALEHKESVAVSLATGGALVVGAIAYAKARIDYNRIDRAYRSGSMTGSLDAINRLKILRLTPFFSEAEEANMRAIRESLEQRLNVTRVSTR